MRGFISVALCVALAGCGTSTSATKGSNGGSAVNATSMRLKLASNAFADGQPIPTRFTCDGEKQSPALKWGDPPAGTKSFALVIDDPDAPSGTFRHWGAYDIPASARGIGEGQKLGAEVNNDKGMPGYTGPCPPKGNGPHHYHFKLFALDTGKLGLPPNAKISDVEQAAEKHTLAKGELVGTYERK